nr:hypothetical protein [Bovine gammaherpesvirus 4]
MIMGRARHYIFMLILFCLLTNVTLQQNNTTVTHDFDMFHQYNCTADRFPPTLLSFSSIWAILNVLIVLLATILYCLYTCFYKFVHDMVKL